MPTRNNNNGLSRLEKTLAILDARFSEYPFLTRLTDDLVAQMEKAGGVKLNATRRAAIELALKRFEFFTRLELQDYGRKFRNVLGLLEKRLAEVTLIARTLDNLPGHLWSYVGDGSLLADDIMRNLEARKNRVKELIRLADAALKGRPYPYLEGLLTELAAEYKKAGGKSVGISRKVEDRRGGPFVDFCDAAVRALPRSYGPLKSVGSRWEQAMSPKGKARRRPIRNVIGRVHPALAK